MKRYLLKLFFSIAIFSVSMTTAWSKLSLPSLFSDHMVLQREMAIPVWGTANVDQELTVELGNEEMMTKADQGGNWKVLLTARKAGGPFELIIRSKTETISVTDVWIGEVWLCSGQSNMEWPLKNSSGGQAAINKADHPNIRLFRMSRRHTLGPIPFTEEELAMVEKGDFMTSPSWQLCQPASAADFSGVGYYFGKQLADSLGVTIGLIQNAVGGSPIQSWISKKSLLAHPQLALFGKTNWMEALENHPWIVQRVKENMDAYLKEKGQEKALAHPFAPAYLFNAGIRSLTPYPLAGVIWYQGESNATHPASYRSLFEMMVKDWRKAWDNEQLPFLFVQLPRIGTRSRWPEFRQQQAKCLEIEHTGMVVAIDEGHPTDVHPKEKQVLGNRLGRLALASVYKYNILANSPSVFNYQWTPEKQRIKLSFSHTGAGFFLSSGQKTKGFRLQGYFAQGTKEEIIEPLQLILEKESLTITYPKGFLVTRVSYAWAPFPDNNVINSAGLPLAPFLIELPGNY